MRQLKNNFLSGHPIIAQLLALIPKEVFDQCVKQENSDKYYKKLKTKDHFICMFYAVLTKNGSPRLGVESSTPFYFKPPIKSRSF